MKLKTRMHLQAGELKESLEESRAQIDRLQERDGNEEKPILNFLFLWN